MSMRCLSLVWLAALVLLHSGLGRADEKVEFERHWSFVPPRASRPPEVRDTSWSRGAIDRFVLARLDREGWKPSAEAGRRTLIRRLSLDLLGLPPSVEEVEAFLADRRPGAYGRLVDRLLASPRFGERMAIEWLDVSRYADTHGYHEDYHRDMWPWRDWVIRSLNDNMPFDRFTIEQLAGDLLPNPTQQQITATGFNRNHGVTASGISEEYRVEYVLDRVRTTATAWMGLTLACAQCHDHKYDPFSQQDFYRFFAYFNSVTDKGVENRAGNVDPLIQVVPLDQKSVEQKLATAIKELERQRLARVAEAGPLVARWEKSLPKGSKRAVAVPTDGLAVHCRLDEAAGQEISGGSSLKASLVGPAQWISAKLGGGLQLGGKTYASLGDTAGFDRTDSFSYGGWVRGASTGAIVSRMDDSADYRGWDVYLSGGHVEVHMIHSWPDNAMYVKSAGKLPTDKWTHVFVSYDGSSRVAGISLYFNGKKQEVGSTRDALSGTIRTDKPLHLGRRNPSGILNGAVDDVRIYSRALSAVEVKALAGGNGLSEILAIAPRKRTPTQRTDLARGYLELHDSRYRSLVDRLARRRSELAAYSKNRPTVMVMQDLKAPRQSFVLVRGQYDQHGDTVEPGVPEVLPPLPEGAPANRLGLARWLVDDDHPLTARVAVNRLWQVAFGRGLVESSEDFGTQGEQPSHPKLLDWLAREYVRSGWDTKALLRLIVTSSTYRQSSRMTRRQWLQDPHNRLLARASRFRLPAELIRDGALAAGGLLVERIGGPSVKPYQPPGLWKETSNRPYVQDSGAALYRRSLYTYWKRSVPPPNLFALDAPTRETCITRRQRTNTPLMALVLMNDPTFVEAARGLAVRTMLRDAVDDVARVEWLFVAVTARRPGPQELETMVRLIADQRTRFRGRPQAARELLSVGQSPLDKRVDVVEQAAWTALASVLLNTDEAITRE